MIVGLKIVDFLNEIATIIERLKATFSKIIKSYHEHGFVELPKTYD